MSDIEKRGWTKLGQVYDRISETHPYFADADPIFAVRLLRMQDEIEKFANGQGRQLIFAKNAHAKLVVRPLT